jgi:hypothetical protein
MHDRASKLLATATLLVAAPLSASCSSQTDHFTVNEAAYLHDGATLAFRGGGCSFISLPGSGGADDRGAGAGDFNFTEGPDGDTFLVRVFSDQELLIERRYTETMLASGTVDEFSVKTHAGAVYTLRYWGGPCKAPGADGSID